MIKVGIALKKTFLFPYIADKTCDIEDKLERKRGRSEGARKKETVGEMEMAAE